MKKRFEPLVYVTLTSLITKPDWCPKENEIKLEEQLLSTLIQTAKNNKLIPLLYHFIECKSCQAFIPPKRKKEIAQLYKSELVTTIKLKAAKGKIITALKQAKIDFCLVKNWRFYPELYKDFARTSTDIDILISEKERLPAINLLSKLGYRRYDQVKFTTSDTKRVYYEEYVVRHKVTFVKVDLRYLATMPDVEQYPLFLPKKVRKLSSEMLKYENTVNEPLPKELFLLNQIMHFFSNDLMRGLRHLYEVIFLAEHYKDKINWRRFDKLARRYNVRLVAMFVFSFAKDVFGFSLEYPYEGPTISERLSLALARFLIAPQHIVFFPKIETWADTIAPISRENKLLRLYLSQNSFFYKLSCFARYDIRTTFAEKATLATSIKLAYKKFLSLQK